MPATFVPNWETYDVDDIVVPTDYQGLVAMFQPVPSQEQSVTVIKVWCQALSGEDVAAQHIDIKCFDGWIEDGNVFTGTRQIGSTFTVGMPAVADDAPLVIKPVLLQFVDTAPQQSGCYVVVYDTTNGASIAVEQESVAITATGP